MGKIYLAFGGIVDYLKVPQPLAVLKGVSSDNCQARDMLRTSSAFSRSLAALSWSSAITNMESTQDSCLLAKDYAIIIMKLL